MANPIIQAIICGDIETEEDLQRAKKNYAKTLRMAKLPSNADILALASEYERPLVEDFLRMKPTRTLSGVAVVAVMTSPEDCPHGKCAYCPGGVENNSPQSYTGREPAALRADQNQFDPHNQTKNRILALEEIGHPTDKIDLIIMGGTFTAREQQYQETFVKRCLDAMNGQDSRTLQKAQKLNETALHRCIGLTVETRPDYFLEEQIEQSVLLGATRVELGVQTIYDNVLEKVERGHGIAETKKATRLARDHGLKICYHMMPGLPGVTREMDLEAFKTIFSNPDYMPDMLKIYPTLVLKGTKTYKKWEEGEYEPLNTQQAAELVAEIKTITPQWVRIQRVQRDIPSPLVDAGVKKSNLRQYAQAVLDEHGQKCNCIRCREIGRAPESMGGEVEEHERSYSAGGGEEAFITLEIDNWLVGFVRVRKPSPQSLYKDMALVRELKVFGQEVPIGQKGTWQHRGYGKRLMELAEKKARVWDKDKVRVTSGIGTREYYRRLGYILEEMGMVKTIGE